MAGSATNTLVLTLSKENLRFLYLARDGSDDAATFINPPHAGQHKHTPNT